MPRTKHPSSLVRPRSAVHDSLADRIVVFIADPAKACTGGNGIDPYQPQRETEFLPRHCDQRLDRALVQQGDRGHSESLRRKRAHTRCTRDCSRATSLTSDFGI